MLEATGPLARAAGPAWGPAWLRQPLEGEEVGDREAETGEVGLAVEHFLSAERHRPAPSEVRGDGLVARIDDPDRLSAGGEVLGHLRGDLLPGVARGHHLDRQVRCAYEVGSPAGRGGQPAGGDEGDIGTPHGVGISRQDVARLDEDPSQAALADEREEQRRHLGDGPSVPFSG